MKSFLNTLLFFCLASSLSHAQVSPPGSSLVTVDPETQNANVAIDFAIIDFNTTGSGSGSNVLEAGMPFPAVGNTMWVNYTYRQPGPDNLDTPAEINVLATGIPPGVTLTLVPIGISNSGFGNMPLVNQVLANNVTYNFITNISAGFSGNGINNGFEVSYLIDNPNNENLDTMNVEYSIGY